MANGDGTIIVTVSQPAGLPVVTLRPGKTFQTVVRGSEQDSWVALVGKRFALSADPKLPPGTPVRVTVEQGEQGVQLRVTPQLPEAASAPPTPTPSVPSESPMATLLELAEQVGALPQLQNIAPEALPQIAEALRPWIALFLANSSYADDAQELLTLTQQAALNGALSPSDAAQLESMLVQVQDSEPFTLVDALRQWVQTTEVRPEAQLATAESPLPPALRELLAQFARQDVLPKLIQAPLSSLSTLGGAQTALSEMEQPVDARGMLAQLSQRGFSPGQIPTLRAWVTLATQAGLLNPADVTEIRSLLAQLADAPIQIREHMVQWTALTRQFQIFGDETPGFESMLSQLASEPALDLAEVLMPWVRLAAARAEASLATAAPDNVAALQKLVSADEMLTLLHQALRPEDGPRLFEVLRQVISRPEMWRSDELLPTSQNILRWVRLAQARAETRLGRSEISLPEGLHDRLDSLARQEPLMRFLQEQGTDRPFQDSAQRLMDRLTGGQLQNLRSLEQPYFFLEVPFGKGSGIQNGQIHFFAEGGRPGLDADHASVVLDLETTRLGQLWISLTITKGRCSCAFRTTNPTVAEAIRDAETELLSGLDDAGYANSMMHVHVWDGERLEQVAALFETRRGGLNLNA